jgi:NAD+ synthase
MNYKQLQLDISTWLKEYLNKSNLKCFVIGISGGIDSAVTSTLCAETGEKTIVLSMPIHQANDQLERANKHIAWLEQKYTNVISFTKNLTSVFELFKSLFETENKLALANSRSRLRMTTLYHIAGIYNGLVVGTGNKVEDFGVGFFTKYGDGGVDISPIADLTKTEVRELGKTLQIDNDIIQAKPTDGLCDDDKTDEEQLGATYTELEWAMEQHKVLDSLTPRQQEVIEIYKSFNTKNKHKMIPIPVFKRFG